MRGFVDLHCHWIADVDDGARSVSESLAMLRALHASGFDLVIGTPHMRPGMFDTTRESLRAAFERMQPHLLEVAGLPRVELSSEHFFDDVVYQRVLGGTGLPYPGDRAVLFELYESDFPLSLDRLLAELRRGPKLVPVIAHPERYQRMWRDPEVLERLLDVGAAALLDAAALVGKYGRKAQRCAEDLLERGLYHAACSDAHRPADVEEVARGMLRVRELHGPEEEDFLFREGPLALLQGRIPE